MSVENAIYTRLNGHVFLSELAGSSVPIESIVFIYTSEILGTLQSSKPHFGILFTTNDVRCGLIPLFFDHSLDV